MNDLLTDSVLIYCCYFLGWLQPFAIYELGLIKTRHPGAVLALAVHGNLEHFHENNSITKFHRRISVQSDGT